MDTATFSLILTAAVLHASWNILTKRFSGSRIALLWFGELLAGLSLLPFAFYELDPLVWTRPWLGPVIVTSFVHALYTLALGMAYRNGDVSIVYPVARGTGIVGTALMASVMAIDRISLLGFAGILTVVAGIFGICLRSKQTVGSGLSGLRMAFVVGMMIATYSILDKLGVGILPPFLYLALLTILSGILLMPYVYFVDQPGTVEVLRRHKKLGLGIGCMSVGTYLLILWAFQHSPASYVVAVREFSIVIASTLGFSVLKEQVSPGKIAGILLILLGSSLIKLA